MIQIFELPDFVLCIGSIFALGGIIYSSPGTGLMANVHRRDDASSDKLVLFVVVIVNFKCAERVR